MTSEDLMQQARLYGAKDRIALKNKLLQFSFDGKEYRKEYQFFDSKNVLLIETDGKKDIKKVTVWKDTEKASHQEFKLKLPPMKAKYTFPK